MGNEAARPVADNRVLDFGCGAGEESVYLAKLGARVTAIDVSPRGIALTRARAEANGVADLVDAWLMRCDPTAFSDASFDVVHGFGILHHIGLQNGLAEVHRLLRPGGRGVFWEHMGNSTLSPASASAKAARPRASGRFAGRRSHPRRLDSARSRRMPSTCYRVCAYGCVGRPTRS